ncbi:MAG: VOC family protein [Verrucomicrobiota bacterium]
MKLGRILETVLYAEDLAAAEKFYIQVLGLDLVEKMEGRHLFFRYHSGMFLIFNPFATEKSPSELPLHGSHGIGHVAWAISLDELPYWRETLNTSHVPIVKETSWGNGSHSIYFHDPAGNSLEFATPSVWGMTE